MLQITSKKLDNFKNILVILHLIQGIIFSNTLL